VSCRPLASAPVDRCVDLFASGGHLDAQLHPGFRRLRDSPLFAPARALLNSLQRVTAKADDAWLERFRTAGFDDCVFGIYLMEMFTAAGHTVQAMHDCSRLLLSKGDTRAVVDPVMSGESTHEMFERKLREHAWAFDSGLDSVSAYPYVLAAQCSAAAHSTLATNLFQAAGAENVSALLLCGDSSIVCKFNRVGQEGSHRSDAVRMLRYGLCRGRSERSALKDETFAYEVGRHATGPERWNEETVLVHNPNARRPIPCAWLGASTEAESTETDVGDVAPPATPHAGFIPLSSSTDMLPGDTPTWWVEDRTRALARDSASHAAHAARDAPPAR
jgi:hypothetical protein